MGICASCDVDTVGPCHHDHHCNNFQYNHSQYQSQNNGDYRSSYLRQETNNNQHPPYNPAYTSS